MITVLLIDDDEMEQRLFDAFITRSGLDVAFHYARTLEKGVEMGLALQPGVIFLDDRLAPYESCADTIPKLHAAGIASPIVVISAAIDVFDANRYLNAGANGFVDKSEINLATIGDLIMGNCAVENPEPMRKAGTA